MPLSDFLLVFQWWGTLFLIGAAAYPFTKTLFRDWWDRGFLFTKSVGIALSTFGVFVLATFHIAPFTTVTVWAVLVGIFLLGIPLYMRIKEPHAWKQAALFAAEELFFFVALLFWTWIKAHEPSIHSLEKFMDFGFTQSILNSRWFPAPDMWYAGHTINYYYFGHTVMAVLTRFSGIDLGYTFNLMLATIFAFSLTMSFSIGYHLLPKGRLWGGILTAFLVTLAGNMQTIYAFTQGYEGEHVVPFWKLGWTLQGLSSYWYANATRFIPYTIHEFPSYSFVVSDMHGHVLSIPFVLVAIALLITIWLKKKIDIFSLIFYGFLCGVLLMTNALDGPIYLGLFIVLIMVLKKWRMVVPVIAAAIVTSLPFLLHFTSFVSGIAVNCPPAFLANTKIGPILFEGVEKCQHSPLWMWWLLWGFFIYCGSWLVMLKKLSMRERLLGILFFCSVLLLIFPEFFYFKDIYPMHFRSNTMFKLGYQAFIMLSIISGYTIVTLFRQKLFLLFLLPQLFLISVYPIFSVRTYFDNVHTYKEIYGLGWLKDAYPDDYEGILWLNAQHLAPGTVLVEADGDSYTDFNRFSSFTGFPTIVGWGVHEWLWRGSYDVVSPRRDEVQKIYESTDISLTKQLLTKYHVAYIIVGAQERQKYVNLQEQKLKKLGTAVFTHGTTVLYRTN